MELFEYDPRGFLNAVTKNAVFDEVQKVPLLFPCLQEILDNKQDYRKFILTGSNNLKLSSKISQTLAGRTRVLQLLPLQRDEIPKSHQKKSLDESLLFGEYKLLIDGLFLLSDVNYFGRLASINLAGFLV